MRERQTQKTNHVMSADPSRFLGKAIKSKKWPLAQAVSMTTASTLLVYRCEILEWQILDWGKRGFCEFLQGCFLRSIFVCQLATSAGSLASGMCPPQQSLNSYQGDEDVLGSERADLSQNG